MNLLSKTFLIVCCLCATTAFAQMPANYYNQARNFCGEDLRHKLYTIIVSHTILEYGQLWEKFYQTDIRNGDTICDIYSSCDFIYSDDQCGSYNGECVCYNREHTIPQSWFGDASPMKTDLFHIYPTDGAVNGKRGNLPLGTVSNPTYTSSNGSKVGPCTYPGYTGNVFEPIDEYKGDLARTYFYMSVCYYNKDLGQTSESMFEGSQLKSWAMQMLLEWHYADPVSQKEIDRNNAIYNIQHNRNPFIDCPYFVDAIWHDHCDFEACLGQDADVQDTKNISQLSAYPNPTAENIDITSEKTMTSIAIFDILGKKTFDTETDNNFATINVEQYEDGVYFVRVIFEDGTSATTRIIKY